MDVLKKASNRIVSLSSTSFKRYLYDEVDFGARLIILKGSRGVGKTTLMLQYLKENCDPEKSLFISLDHIVFTEHRLLKIIDEFYEKGYRHFALDEVHKYPDWSIEIKNIYDSYPDVQLVVTASSALDIMKGMADLSRRADVYLLHGLSFREYLTFDKGYDLEKIDFGTLVKDHAIIASDLLDETDLISYFKTYLKRGYYPYFKESKVRYHDRIRNVLNQVIEVDLPPIFSIDYSSIRQLKHLLSIISRIAPFTPNITKLASELGIGRNRVLLFLDYLSRAGVINVLKSGRKSDSALSKPDKILLNNTNVSYALSLDSPAIGTLRETFLLSALASEQVTTPLRGDFMINDSYVIEVGGPNKSMHQIYDMPNPILVKDGLEIGSNNIMPLWIFGLLY